MSHPLDRPVWYALTTYQREFAERAGAAVRLRPDYGIFAAAADVSPESRACLAALQCGPDGLWCVELDAVEPPSGMVVHHQARCVQMVAGDLAAPDTFLVAVDLTDRDAPDIFSLARMTEPGPFFEHTHRMGNFIGIRENGRLIAMAGQRLRFDGHTEVSGVCTHPDYRARGYASALIRRVAARIIARGETPFLHSYADNAGAIALYERLGFRVRRHMVLTVLCTA